MTISLIAKHRPSRLCGGPALCAGFLLASAVAALTELHAQNAPVVSSVTPANGATGVGSTTPLVFVFDQAMDTTVPLFGSVPPVLVGNFEIQPANLNSQMSGEWGEDGRTLTLRPSLSVPLNITISWKLNPSGALFPIKSETGTPLATVSGSYTTGAAAPGPSLVSTIPADGATGVGVSTAVVFFFDQEMKTNTNIGGSPPAVPGAVSWSGIGLDPAKFSYEWSADALSLVCSYLGELPVNTLVTWVLNSPVAPIKLENKAGTVLAAGHSGDFMTGGGVPGCDPDGIPDTWGYYSIFKRWVYEQNSAAAPRAATNENPYFLLAAVRGPMPNPTPSGGSLRTPDTTEHALDTLGGIGRFYDTPATETAFDSAYPPGDYTLRFTLVGQPERVIPMTMTDVVLPVPTILNFAASQSVDATANFVLQWNGFPAVTDVEHISMSLGDESGNILFQAPDPCVPRELPASAKSILIPANTLLPGRTYTGSLLFGRFFYQSTNTVPQMAGFGDMVRETHFTIKTGSGGNPVAAARFTAFRLLPSGNPELTLVGTPARAYAIQRSGSVVGSAWQEIGTATMDAGGNAVFEDAQSGKVFPLFYRAVAN